LKVLVLGAGGFIDGHAAAALRAAGHQVVAGRLDFERAAKPEDWLASVQGMDAVVNAVGIIRESGGRTFNALHYAAPRALFDACASAGVRRVLQVSALGAAIYVIRRWLWRLQMGLIVAYSALIAVGLPELWLHPFGPLLKNLPMLAAIMALHELEERG